MEINLRTKPLQYLAPVCVKTVSSEYSFELTPGDVQPDLGQVLTLDTVILLRSKDPQPGRCLLSCCAETTLTYTEASGDGVHSINTSYPFDISIEDAQINSDNLVTAAVECISAESRSVGSRKIVVKLVVLCYVRCFGQKEILIPIAPEEEKYEIKMAVCNTRLITAVDEKRFELSSNFLLDGPPAVELMSHKVMMELNDAAVSFDKIVVTGAMNLFLLYRPAGNVDLIFAEHSEPFRIEIPFIATGSAAACSAQVAITSAYVTNEPGLSGDGKSIGFDIGAVVQYYVDESVDITYLADMYSTAQKVSCTFEKTSINEKPIITESEVNLQEDILADDGVQQFLCGYALPSAVSASREDEDVYACPVHVSVMYRNTAGQVCQKKCKINSSAAFPKCKPVCVTARAGDIVVVPSGAGCTIRLNIIFSAMCSKDKTLDFIGRSVCDFDDMQAAAPALWISRYSADKTLWDICKQHRVSERFVRAANMLNDKEIPEQGTLLLIPKA